MVLEKKIPDELESWIKERCVKYISSGSYWPGNVEQVKEYVLCSVPLKTLTFNDPRFNPREPDQKKTNQLKASIYTMGLFSPLTCAYLEKRGKDEEVVVLIDGRHRFKALQQLAENDQKWGSDAIIDLKIFFGLPKSDLHAMATYLNKTRKKLKKGEYYKAIVNIYNERRDEIEASEGRMPEEKRIINSIEATEFIDKNFDFTIGRIIGLVAFDEEEEGSWYPFVGLGQREKINLNEYPTLRKRLNFSEYDIVYKPITAGSLAEFIQPLCHEKPYDDIGAERDIEINNVRMFGAIFSGIFFTKELLEKQGDKNLTATKVGCKYWCIVSLGQLMLKLKEDLKNGFQSAKSIMSCEEPNWNLIKDILRAYKQVMEIQAEYVSDYLRLRKEEAPLDEQDKALKKAWSYYTSRNRVMNPLQRELKDKGINFSKG